MPPQFMQRAEVGRILFAAGCRPSLHQKVLGYIGCYLTDGRAPGTFMRMDPDHVQELKNWEERFLDSYKTRRAPPMRTLKKKSVERMTEEDEHEDAPTTTILSGTLSVILKAAGLGGHDVAAVHEKCGRQGIRPNAEHLVHVLPQDYDLFIHWMQYYVVPVIPVVTMGAQAERLAATRLGSGIAGSMERYAARGAAIWAML